MLATYGSPANCDDIFAVMAIQSFTDLCHCEYMDMIYNGLHS